MIWYSDIWYCGFEVLGSGWVATSVCVFTWPVLTGTAGGWSIPRGNVQIWVYLTVYPRGMVGWVYLLGYWPHLVLSWLYFYYSDFFFVWVRVCGYTGLKRKRFSRNKENVGIKWIKMHSVSELYFWKIKKRKMYFKLVSVGTLLSIFRLPRFPVYICRDALTC